jgi:structure-specific endonuclease subunit SLX1
VSTQRVPHGLAALAVDYSPHRAYIEKSKDIIDFEREGSCSICSEKLKHGAGIYTICPHAGCESVSHLSCLSQHFLDGEANKEAIIPIQGNCKDCGSLVRWVDIMKDVTLRMRGEKEATKLLKPVCRRPVARTAAKGKSKEKGAAAGVEIVYSSDIEDDQDELELGSGGFRDLDDNNVDSELDLPRDDAKFGTRSSDEWLDIDDSDDET